MSPGSHNKFPDYSYYTYSGASVSDVGGTL